jgi:hypothetical protein
VINETTEESKRSISKNVFVKESFENALKIQFPQSYYLKLKFVRAILALRFWSNFKSEYFKFFFYKKKNNETLTTFRLKKIKKPSK